MADPLIAEVAKAAPQIKDFYEDREYSKALRRIMELADTVNEYVDREKPWELAKTQGKEAALQRVASVALEAFR